MFQALVAGVARRGELVIGIDTAENTNFTDTGKAIDWLQKLAPPIIIAPKAKTGQAITRNVPNNDGDKKFDRQERLTAKHTEPTLFLLEPDQKPEVHYVWDISNQSDVPVERIRDAARSLTTLGWGIDMAFADARPVSQAEVESLPGVRWHPKPGVWRDEGMLRTPTLDEETQQCSMCDLRHCHETAMNRIQHGQPLRTVDKPKVFEPVLYTSIERSIGRPAIVFELRNDDDTFFRYRQDRLIHIAGMVRHLSIEAMRKSLPNGVADDWVETYVAGHRRGSAPDTTSKNKCVDDADNEVHREELRAADEHRQLSYLPLPSIGHAHTDPSIRRVMIVAPLGDDRLLEHLARRLAGEQLEPTRQTKLEHPPTLVRVRNDNVASFYTTPANHWASVTPVILPGHDDHKAGKTQKLIEKALAQSGIEQSCDFEWSAFSRFTKSLSAHKYGRDKRPSGYIRPGHLLNQTAVHLTLRFKDAVQVPGPIAIGAGRHCGFGLMAIHPQ